MVQLEIWCARFPPGQKRGRSSPTDNIPGAESRRRAPLEDPDEEDGGARPGPAIDGDCAGGNLLARAVLVNEGYSCMNFSLALNILRIGYLID